jgi:DNA-binding transcriptional ArsR family regulator
MRVMPADTVLAANERRVLAALVRVETALTGRAVARITGLTQSTAQRALTRLREAGLVVAEPVPPSLLYRPNPEHLAMPAMLALLQLDDELRVRITDHVAGWRLPPAAAVIYRSVARGEARPRSDLDILVVRPDTPEPDDAAWQLQLATLGDHVQRWSGRRASIIEMSRDEVNHGLTSREPFLVEAARDGWVVAGKPLPELARSGS